MGKVQIFQHNTTIYRIHILILSIHNDLICTYYSIVFLSDYIFFYVYITFIYITLINYITCHYYLRQGGYVFCLFVCRTTQKLLDRLP